MEEDNRLISFYTAPAPPQQRLYIALHWARNVWDGTALLIGDGTALGDLVAEKTHRVI